MARLITQIPESSIFTGLFGPSIYHYDNHSKHKSWQQLIDEDEERGIEEAERYIQAMLNQMERWKTNSSKRTC